MLLGIAPTTTGRAPAVPMVEMPDVMVIGDPLFQFKTPPNCHFPTICCTQPGALPINEWPVPKGNSYVPLLVIWNLRSTACSVLSVPRKFGSTVPPVSNALLHT